MEEFLDFQRMNFILPQLKIYLLKKNAVVVGILALFSMLAGYLLSSISFVGKAGISLFYQQYQFLKIWWKSALLVFVVWVLLLIVQTYVNKKVSKSAFAIVSAVSLLSATAGLFFSYTDFRHSLSHRWLGERFHLGVYLFWLVWIAISVYVVSESGNAKQPTL